MPKLQAGKQDGGNKRSLRRAMGEIGTLPWFAAFILTFCVMSSRDLFFATAMGGLMENALTGDLASLNRYLYYLGFAAAVSIPLQISVVYFDGLFNIWGTRNLFRQVFPRFGKIPEAVFEKGNTATMQSRMTGDVNSVQRFFSSEMASIVWTCAYSIVPFFYLFYINPVLSLICYGVIPVFYWALSKMMKAVSQITDELSAANADALVIAQESVTQAETVKSYALEETMLERYRKAQEKALALIKRRKLREAVSGGVNYAVYILPTVLMVVAGVWFLQRGSLTVAGLIIFIQMGGHGQWFIMALSEMIAQMRAANGYMGRIYDAADTPPEREGGEIPSPDTDTVLAFEDVSFGYEGRGETLKGLSFSIRRGETVAIVGESGSGKSTVFKLIEGFYPPINGKATAFGGDIGKIDLHKLRDFIAIVPQDPFFITGTLRDNLVFGADIDDSRILEALSTAGLGDLQEIWPDGLEMKVAERGSNMSGGQKQRIAIARAILRNAQLLLFDEVTSALDYENEREILGSISALSAKHTMLIISHRLSVAQGADRILVLDGGCVAEEGSHDALLAKGGIYAGLHRIESEGRHSYA